MTFFPSPSASALTPAEILLRNDRCGFLGYVCVGLYVYTEHPVSKGFLLPVTLKPSR